MTDQRCVHRRQTTGGSNQYQALVTCLDCRQRLMVLSWRADRRYVKQAARNVGAMITYDNEQPPSQQQMRQSEEEFEVIAETTTEASTQTDPIAMMTPENLSAILAALEAARPGQA